MKTDKNHKGIYVKKVVALYSAGWNNKRIAHEMKISVENVDEILRDHEKDTAKEKEQDDVKEECSNPKKLVVITAAELREIYEKAAAIGAREALKTFEQERKREYSERADRRLRNTKLLLRNYHMLKEHAENSVFGRIQMEESAADILESMMSMYDNKVIIDSIKRSASRTAIIVSHIEVMLGLYESYCEKSASREVDRRRFGVLWDRYMAEQPLDVKEIAQKYNMSKENVYSDLNVATERVSALIFGVDGLKVR